MKMMIKLNRKNQVKMKNKTKIIVMEELNVKKVKK